MTSLGQILLLVLDIVWFLVLAQVIISWLVSFEVLNLRQPLVYQFWSGLNRLLEPIYRPIRSVLPQMSGLDITPLIVIVAIYALRIVIAQNFF
ncbi:YggT family protein [Rhodobacteraceae bacterium 2CG4]|uniref:YggT family protein n=1 Tax=Halovulum marinum TaxID=2662447 RepID=A0A6L5YVF9_9RHOB|nr:YggT family protein [Halovulum marinum]MSU88238.1 YggT family protein [Halovulum marinum]